nr:hypothetical protein [Tanacetum cinerariifolium]
MQEFWATTTVHHHAIRFKMDNKKHIVNLESFRDMLHICPRNSNAYKEYYAVAIGEAPPKPKSSVRKARSSFDTTTTPLAAAVAKTEAQQINLATTRSLQQTHISQASGSGTDKETGSIPGVLDVPTDDLSTHTKEEPMDEESFDPIPRTPKNSDDEGNGEENLSLNVGREEGHDEEEEEDELYRDVNINQGMGIQMTQEFEDSHVTLIPVNPDGQQQSSSVSSQFVTSMLNPTLDVGMELILETTSQMHVQTLTSVASLPMSAPTLTSSTIANITTTQQAPTPPTTAPSTLIQDLPNFGSLLGFNNRLRTLEANFSEFMQTNQFARAVSAIPGIVHRYMDQRMNEAVKVAIQIQSDRLCEEAQKENDEFLKTIDENMQKIIKEQVKEQVKVQVSKILPKIEQIVNEQLEAESIERSDEQRNLYKALVDAYKSDKIILDTYRETVTLKRRRDDDADKDEEPFAGLDWGSNRRREGNEPDESAIAEEPMQTTFQMEEPSHLEFDTGVKDQPIVQSSQHPEWFSQQQKPPTPDRALSRKYTTSVTKTKAADYRHIKWTEDLESARDVYSKRRIIAITELKVVEWHNYKHLDWITVRRDDDKLYKFKEGDFKMLRIQDIEDMLLLLRRVEDLQLGVESYQKKLNLTKPDTYRSNLKRKEAYTAYSNPRGFIYQNKDKQNRLIQIDELHKFSDGTLTDVRTALDDRLKGIQMKYLP